MAMAANGAQFGLPGMGMPQTARPTLNHDLPNATVGVNPGGGPLGLPEPVKGYALDLNQNGRYEAGQDGVLAFDFDKNGETSTEEIKQSRLALQTMNGNFDLNGDGDVGTFERAIGEKMAEKFRGQLDTTGDGVLDNAELQAGGARVLVDQDRNGQFAPEESHTAGSFPAYGGQGRLDFVDPRGASGVSQAQPLPYYG